MKKNGVLYQESTENLPMRLLRGKNGVLSVKSSMIWTISWEGTA
jgi:hypothetical protein